MIDLELSTFRGWVESQTPGAMIGYANDCTACPVARFLRVYHNVFEPIVDKGQITYYTGPNSYGWTSIDTPEWASRFIELVDGPVEELHIAGDPVYADEVLEALNVVEESTT